MFAQAAGFAFLAALSPTSLVVMAVFLGSASPRQAALAYVTGALVMSVAMAVAVLLVIRGFGLDQPRSHDPRYGLRIGLGVLALAAAVVVSRRPVRPSARSGGLMSRLIERPSARTAFVAGLILFAPGATFVAAVQVVATARLGITGTVLGLVIVVAISALIVWLPLLGFLAAPHATARRLSALNNWLQAHGKTIAVWALSIAGVALVANGVLGLAGVV